MKKNNLPFLFSIIIFPIVYLFFNKITGHEFQWGVLLAIITGSGMGYLVQLYKMKKYGTPEVDERVRTLANKYINNVFICATVVLVFTLIVVKEKGIAAIPIDYLFVYLLLLVLSMSAAVMVAKSR